MARLGADFLSAHSLRGRYPQPGLGLVDSSGVNCRYYLDLLVTKACLPQLWQLK